MKNRKRKEYEAPQTVRIAVELEEGFMKASVFEGGTENAEDVTIEEHGFAHPDQTWEGNYDSWD